MSNQPVRIDEGDGVWPPDNYTGEWAYHWPNRQLKYHAWYVNGETDGEVLCFWDNGNLAQRGVSEAGVCRGLWTDYREDGSKSKETDYSGNSNCAVRHYGLDGTLLHTEIWRDGNIIYEEGDLFGDECA